MLLHQIKTVIIMLWILSVTFRTPILYVVLKILSSSWSSWCPAPPFLYGFVGSNPGGSSKWCTQNEYALWNLHGMCFLPSPFWVTHRKTRMIDAWLRVRNQCRLSRRVCVQSKCSSKAPSASMPNEQPSRVLNSSQALNLSRSYRLLTTQMHTYSGNII